MYVRECFAYGLLYADQCRQSGRQQALRAPCTAGGLFTAGATREAPCAPVFLPGESHGQRSLVSYRPWGCRVGHDRATNTLYTYFYILFHRGSSQDVDSVPLGCTGGPCCLSILCNSWHLPLPNPRSILPWHPPPGNYRSVLFL